MVGGCDSGDRTPVATVRAGATGMPDLASVGAAASKKCDRDHDRVRVRVVVAPRPVDATVVCDDVRRAGPTGVTASLLTASAAINDSGAKAARVVALQRLLPAMSAPYAYDLLAWSLVRGDAHCTRRTGPGWVRDNIAEGITLGNSPEEWTRVEAVLDAGVCPDRLSRLYGNVAAAGHPDAAETVRREIERAAKTAGVPLTGGGSHSSRG
jgi:hypothetical protein